MRGVTQLIGMSIALLSSPYAQAGDPLYPDLQTVIPQQIQLKNDSGREVLRFSNGVANTGAGDLRMRAEIDPLTGEQLAIQEILDASGAIVEEHVASRFALHPEHNHWHIDDVALYELRIGSASGPLFGAISVKTTFCLIDWYKLSDNAPRPERTYWDCATGYQGLSPGWVDQYHQSLEGQGLDVTGIPVGEYYLVSIANPEGSMVETSTANNTAWVRLLITRQGNGTAKAEVLEASPCSSPGLCGEDAPNR